MAVRPPPADLAPLIWTWPAGYSIARAHPSTLGSSEFDRREDADARWSTIMPGQVQGVLYGARQWAEALWWAAPAADGLYWISRQAPGRSALMLFEKRNDRPGGVTRHELFADGPPDAFLYPEGLERLYLLAARLNITILV